MTRTVMPLLNQLSKITIVPPAEVTPIWPMPGQIQIESGPEVADFEVCPLLANFLRTLPIRSHLFSTPGFLLPNSNHNLSILCRFRPMLCKCWSHVFTFVSTSAGIGPSFVKSHTLTGRTSRRFDQLWGEFSSLRRTKKYLARFQPNSARIQPSFRRTLQNLAELERTWTPKAEPLRMFQGGLLERRHACSKSGPANLAKNGFDIQLEVRLESGRAMRAGA